MRRTMIFAATLLLITYAQAEAASPSKSSAKIPHKGVSVKPALQAPAANAIPLLQQGLSALQNKHDAQAEQAFKKALSLMGSGDPNLVVPVNALANLYYRQDRYPEALIFARRAIPLIAKRHGANSINAADSLFLLANVQHHLKDFINAEAGYKQSLAIYELPQNTGKFSHCYTSALENLGNIVGRTKQYDKALGYYHKALNILKQHGAEIGGTLFENIGISYQNQEQPEAAISYYEQALRVYERNPSGNQAEISRLSFKLANMKGNSVQLAGVSGDKYDGQYYESARNAYNIDRNYAEAARLFQLALAQVIRFHPGEKAFIAMLESALGKALYHADDIDAALPYLEKAHAGQSGQLKGNDPELLNTAAILGLAHNGKGNYLEAQKHLQYVKNHADPKSALYGSILMTLADNLCHQGNFQEAKALYDEALTIYSDKGADGAQQVKGIQYQLALLDKMFKSQQGIDELISFSKDGLRRWNVEKAPIYILLNKGSTLPEWNDRYSVLLQKAFQEWQDALPGQVRFEYTDNSDKADVVVNWTDHPIEQSDLEAKIGLHKLATVRSFFFSSEIIISLRDEGKLQSDMELYATALHEIGHMLGLQHSSDLSDVMAAVGNYAIPAQGWPKLSANDILAARTLYSQTAAVTNPPGITLAEYRKFDELATPGIEALKRHQYKQANRIFEQARTIYSQDPYINYFSGLSAFQAGDYKEAREIFENLIMPHSTNGFSVDSQLGLIYVELGHKYNKWGRKNKAISNEFYERGVLYLQKALRSPEVPSNQKEYLTEKLREGINRSRPEPVYVWEFSGPTYRGF